MRYFRIHTADIAYKTKRPRGIFTTLEKLVDSKILTDEEEKEYWKNREYFEKVLPVPPFYEDNNPQGAITWFKDTPDGKDIWNQMTFYRDMCSKYGADLYISECEDIPGEIIYEDEYQIAVISSDKDVKIVTEKL